MRSSWWIVVLLSAVGCAESEPPPVEVAPAERAEPEPEAPKLPEVDAATLPGGYPVAQLLDKPNLDWSRHLLDLHDGMIACLGHAEAPADALIARAWSMSEAKVAARLSSPDGTKWHCEAAKDGSDVTLLPMGSDPDGRLAGEIFFVPADRATPDDASFIHESVINFEAEFLGWLMTRRS